MSHALSIDQLDDPYIRGQVDMFATLVEYQNTYPERIDDAVIDFFYDRVKDYCGLDVKKSVRLLKDGEIITE